MGAAVLLQEDVVGFGRQSIGVVSWMDGMLAANVIGVTVLVGDSPWRRGMASLGAHQGSSGGVSDAVAGQLSSLKRPPPAWSCGWSSDVMAHRPPSLAR
jgi:hypothetical protein